MHYLSHTFSDILKYTIYSLYFTHIISYSYTSLINPGIQIKNINSTEGKKYKICGKCAFVSIAENEVQHCSICNLCFIKRHHHCQWATKCIGEKNLTSFYIFIISTMLFILSLYIGAFTYFKNS